MNLVALNDLIMVYAVVPIAPLLKDEPLGKKDLRALSQSQAATNAEADP